MEAPKLREARRGRRPQGDAALQRSSSAPGGRSREAPPPEPRRRRAASTGRPANKPPRPAAKKKDWSHPKGTKFEELSVESPVDGVVVNVGDYGVFADIGYEQNVILAIPRRFWRRFRRGDVLEDMQVNMVDLKLRRATVGLEDVEQALQGSRVPLEELQEGNYVNGVVDVKNQYGIFVNIGAQLCHGRLQVPRFLGNQLLRGQVLRDLCIATVDVELKRVRLICDDLEGAIEDPEMVSLQTMTQDPDEEKKAPEPPPERRAPKSRSKAKAEAKQETMAVGDLVDGVVVIINNKGVWVDIGIPERGLLEVPPDLKGEFRCGDSVQGMRVEEMPEDGAPVLSMDDPELEVQETKGKSKRPQGKAKGKSTRASGTHRERQSCAFSAPLPLRFTLARHQDGDFEGPRQE